MEPGVGVREGGGGLQATMTTDTCAVAETLSCHKLALVRGVRVGELPRLASGSFYF